MNREKGKEKKVAREREKEGDMEGRRIWWKGRGRRRGGRRKRQRCEGKKEGEERR